LPFSASKIITKYIFVQTVLNRILLNVLNVEKKKKNGARDSPGSCVGLVCSLDQLQR
jgi:hypothetical protein